LNGAALTPVAIVTGFLGSGKTTLISRLLRDPRFGNTAVIVNEFGEIALDHELIASADETLVQLATGCLCCAVRSDLVATLLDLHRRRAAGEIGFARVLIETSGLADPAPILHALMTDAAVGENFAIGGVLTLVDAVLGEPTLARHPEARRQVAFADRLLVSKTDIFPAAESLRAIIRALNATAPMDVAMPDTETLFAPGARLLPDAVAQHTGGIESTVVYRTAPVPAAGLTLWLQSLAEHCGARLLRLKGLVDIAEMPGRPAVIHAVQHVIAPLDWLDRWPGEDRRSRIVLIGEGIPHHFPARLLDAVIDEVREESATSAGPGPPTACASARPSPSRDDASDACQAPWCP
jgi:G3E family GTPase